jgi:GT2 family glycosyltransferase
MSDLAVIVVTHDSAHELEACVASVVGRRGNADVDIAVCDSGSADDVEAVARRLPVHFLAGLNRGFAAACNRGLAASELRAARYVLFLNPDVRLVDGTLSELIAECDRRPRAGIVTVRLLDEHGHLIRNMGRPFTLAEYWRMALVGGCELEWTSSHYDDERECAWVEGSFLLVRRETIDRLGGFDERFFMYSEEVDLCRRASAAGWEVRYLPILTAVHAVADRPFDAHRETLLALSKLIYLRKWYSGWRSVAGRTGLALFYARQMLQQRGAGLSGRRELARARAHLEATLRPDWNRYGPARR